MHPNCENRAFSRSAALCEAVPVTNTAEKIKCGKVRDMCDHLASYPGQEVERGHRTDIFYRTGIVRKKGLETAQRRQKKERHCLFL